MSDLIDRQAAIDAMRKCQTYRFSVTEPRMIMLADAEEVIEELPSAQLTHDCDTCRYNHLEWDEEPCDSCTAGGENNHWKPSAQPEIIHCRDCKYYGEHWYCEAWNNSPGFPIVDVDGYCSLAERREDE